jgi:hypothetical protein
MTSRGSIPPEFIFFEPKNEKRDNVSLKLIASCKELKEFSKAVTQYEKYVDYVHEKIEEQNTQIRLHQEKQGNLNRQLVKLEMFKISVFAKTHPDYAIHLKLTAGIKDIVGIGENTSNHGKWKLINSDVLDPLIKYLSIGLLKPSLLKKPSIWKVVMDSLAHMKPGPFNTELNEEIVVAKKDAVHIKYHLSLEKLSTEDTFVRTLFLYWIYKQTLAIKLSHIFTHVNMKSHYEFNSITMTLPFLCEDLEKLKTIQIKWFE